MTLYIYIGIGLVVLAALAKYGHDKKKLGRAEGRAETMKEARETNEKTRNDIHDVLDDLNAPFRVRHPGESGRFCGDTRNGPPGA